MRRPAVMEGGPGPRMRDRRLLVGVLLALLSFVPSIASAQAPDADWRTVEVDGYRIHFPAPAEEWARHLAERLPAVRARVEGAVGWADPATVDVVLLDPLAQPNGAALPLLGSPRMVLLLTPPDAGSALAEHAGWIDLLAIHEQAHLTHLLRPSRSPLARLLGLPVGPLALRAPRWVIEGYATVIEGRLTGRGRPHGALRAAVLRRWAQLGRLPSYGALSRGGDRYLGGSMAYLAGSAYLEWLEQRAGPESLDHLWRRLTARRARSFDEAFRGVFGESPAALWGVFSAELTWKAVEVQRRLAPTLREGEPWLERSWGTGAPALSRDGTELVVTLRDRDRPARLAVFGTAEDAAAASRREEERARLLRRDPVDVPAVEQPARLREPRATLELPFNSVPPTPRFLPDGSVLFARTVTADDGTLHPDLFRWSRDRSSVERLTRGADLRAADPSPDGTWAVAVRARWGRSSLVRVDLASGGTRELVEPRVTTIVDAPRVSPLGDRLAFMRHDGARWELVVRDLASGEERAVPTPEGAAVADPAWSPDGATLFAAVAARGSIDVEAFAADGTGAPRSIVRTPGAAFAPAPTPDGARLFFLALDADGLEVRTVGLVPELPALAAVELPSELAPAIAPPLPDPPPPLALVEVSPSRSYGVGRPEWSWLSGGSWGASGGSLEAGARGGDLLGRWQALALGALGAEGGGEGGSLAAAWRGWPVAVTAHAFTVEEIVSDQPRSPAAGAGALDGRESGFELGLAWDRDLAAGPVAPGPLGPGRIIASAAVGASRREPAQAASVDRQSLLLLLDADRSLRRGVWRANAALSIAWQPGETDAESWTRGRGSLQLEVGRARGPTAQVRWDRGRLSGTETLGERFRVGGLAGSLLPATARAERVDEPGLPAAALLGVEHETQRAELALGDGLLRLRPFHTRHRVQEVEDRWSEWLALSGIEIDFEVPPLPIARLPAARLRAGAAYVHDEPYRGDVNGWIGIAWRP